MATTPQFTIEAATRCAPPGRLDWSTITLLTLVVYVYAVEIERRNWDVILAGLAFWLMDWVNEIINALVLHFNGHAALWTVTGHSSFVILIGLNVEISLFFAINGVVFAKILPPDKRMKILGIPNRWAISIALSIVSVGVELLLHADGVFHWYYWWWNVASVPRDRRARVPDVLLRVVHRLRHGRPAQAADRGRRPRDARRRLAADLRRGARLDLG